MDRLGHYLKPGVRPTAPGTLFTVVVTPEVHSPNGETGADWYTWRSADVYVAHRSHGRWGRFASASCSTPAALWEWMAAHGDRSRRNYVIVPDGQEGATQAQLWDHLDNGQVYWKGHMPHGARTKKVKYGPQATFLRRAVTSPTTFIVDYMRAGWRWLWLSGRQFFDAPESALARVVDWKWPDTGHLDSPGAIVTRSGNERAALWLQLFMTLSTWWMKHSKAPFGMTASGLSVGMLRTHIRPKYLTTHKDTDVQPLERAACFGGRATTWYFGDIGRSKMRGTEECPVPPKSDYGTTPGPMYQLDVKSMYPYLLREHKFPIALTAYKENATPGEAQAHARSAGVIARVTIETEAAEYPERVGDRIYYRTGRFTTVLTGPELLALRADGKVKHCHALAVYRLGTPYREAAAALIDMREAAAASGLPAWELFAKSVGNGLGGKLAQRKGEWIPRPDIEAPVRFGEWYASSGRRGGRKRYRAIAGIVWEYVPDPTGAGPYTASFAYLAALGRLHMRRIRDGLPDRSVVSMDTDGLWVLPNGYRACKELAGKTGPRAGDLVVKERSASGRFYGPRHYYSSSGWVLAGFSVPQLSQRCDKIRDTQRFTALAGPGGRAGRGTAVRGRDSELAIEAPGLKVERNGWATARKRT